MCTREKRARGDARLHVPRARSRIFTLTRAARAIRAGDRRQMARAITKLESTRETDHIAGQAILESLIEDSGDAIRIGITGPPGVGKSTFIEALGLYLVGQGKRVAVLAVVVAAVLGRLAAVLPLDRARVRRRLLRLRVRPDGERRAAVQSESNI